MINEQFLNSCFSVLLSNSGLKEDKSIYRDIIEVLSFYESKENFEIPVLIQNKFECLKKICELKLDGKSNQNIIDSVTTGKFSGLYDFLQTKVEEELGEDIAFSYVDQIKTKRKLKYVFNSYDKLSNFLELLKSNTFESVEDLVNDYEKYIKRAYTDLSEIGRSAALESASSLDFYRDSCESVLDTIKSKYSKVTKIPSGFYNFDREALNGGFEPSRVYVFGGGTGSGKSTLLNNIIVNNALSRSNKYENLLEDSGLREEENGKRKIYVYITLENTLDEAFLRTYQPLFNITTEQTIKEIKDGIDIEGKLKTELEKNNVNIIMKYFSPNSISCVDIRTILDETLDLYPDAEIRGLCVDYLELLNPEIRFDQYRLELGSIVLSAKSIAVDYRIPVLLPTQLNRSVYRAGSTTDLNMDQMGESIKKAENADFVSVQVRDPFREDTVFFKVVKNRAGKANVSFNFKVDWNTYKFSKCYPVSNSDQSPNNTDESQKFGENEGLSSISSSNLF